MYSNIKLSLVMPAYNEEDAIEGTINKMNQVVGSMGLAYELIVVDDGSVDRTRGKAVKCATDDSHVKVVGYDRNLGKGYAVKTGFRQSTGDIILLIDSDADIDPVLIKRYVQALKNKDIITIASKWHPESRVEMPLMRKFLSHGFNVLVRLLTGLSLMDTQTGLKAARREALERVFSRVSVKRYAFDVELLTVAEQYGFKIVELPVNLCMNSSFNFKEIWKMVYDLLGIVYRLRILKWYQHSSKSQIDRIKSKA